jgi:hypothetical protein
MPINIQPENEKKTCIDTSSSRLYRWEMNR